MCIRDRFYTGLRDMEGRELKAVLVPNTIPGYQPWCLTCEAVPESAEPQAEPPAAAQTRKLDDQVKGEIYRLFKERLPFETPLHLAMVGKLLLDEGYDKMCIRDSSCSRSKQALRISWLT